LGSSVFHLEDTLAVDVSHRPIAVQPQVNRVNKIRIKAAAESIKNKIKTAAAKLVGKKPVGAESKIHKPASKSQPVVGGAKHAGTDRSK
jgi:hypothetical protein